MFGAVVGRTTATTIEETTLIAMIGCALMVFGLWLKATLEETFLREELGPAVYDVYRRRVPMLPSCRLDGRRYHCRTWS